MPSRYSDEIIKKIRKEVLSGKTKYQVAKEMNICEKMIYYYTKNIPSKNPGRTGIGEKTLDVLKTLLTEGFIESNTKNSGNLRTPQKHFKVIKRPILNDFQNAKSRINLALLPSSIRDLIILNYFQNLRPNHVKLFPVFET